jgi:hypothetical protein
MEGSLAGVLAAAMAARHHQRPPHWSTTTMTATWWYRRQLPELGLELWSELLLERQQENKQRPAR